MYYGPEDVRVEDVPEPEPGPGEVKVRVAYNGLCGTDLHEYFDGPAATPVAPHPLTGRTLPVILGHEAAGYVEGVGTGVTDLAPGELVVIEPIVSCGRCRYCADGEHNRCDVLAFHGLSTAGGGLAEHTVVRRSMVHRVPDGLSEQHAAVVEPLAVAHRAVARSGARPGHGVAVHGAGPIGIGVFLALRHLGVDAVVVEPGSHRRDAIGQLGARTVDPSSVDIGEALRQLLDGRDPDVSFETAGAAASFAAAVGTTAKGGTLALVASPRQDIGRTLSTLLARELQVTTSLAYCGDFAPTIEAMAGGAYPLEGWVTTMPLGRVRRAFDLMRDGSVAKVLIDPRAVVAGGG